MCVVAVLLGPLPMGTGCRRALSGAIVSGHMISRRAFVGGAVVHRILLWGMVVAGVVGPVVAGAQTPATDPQNPFRFELEEAQSAFRGRAVGGYVYNYLP